MSSPPTWDEIKQRLDIIEKKITYLELKKGIKQEQDEILPKQGELFPDWLERLKQIAKESKTHEEYLTKLDTKYPILKEDTI